MRLNAIVTHTMLCFTHFYSVVTKIQFVCGVPFQKLQMLVSDAAVLGFDTGGVLTVADEYQITNRTFALLCHRFPSRYVAPVEGPHHHRPQCRSTT
jgi:hypothetical protein